MYLKVLNLSGAALVLPPVGTFQAHADPQYVRDLDMGDYFSTRDGGMNAAEVLRAAKAAGTIDYQFICDDFDLGKVGVKCLRATFARGSFTDADGSQVFADDEALPAGAMLLQAHLDVHAVIVAADAATGVLKSGHSSDDDAFNADDAVLAGATRRQLTDLAVGSDIGGKTLSMTLTLADAEAAAVNISTITAGDVELVVTYIVVPTL